MKSSLATAFAFCLLVSPAFSGEQADPALEKGRLLAQSLCARCHAIGTSGDSPFEPAPPFRTMAQKWPIDSLAEAFAEGIVVGHPAMPEFKFEPEQIGALLTYMESVQTE